MNKLLTRETNKNGYCFDHNTETLYMTKAYKEKTCVYGSKEFKNFMALREMFPNLHMEVSSTKKNASKLGYQQMVDYIKLLPEAKEKIEEFKRHRQMSTSYKCPHKYMERWFNETYPNHGEFRVVNKETGETEWDFAAMRREIEEAETHAVEEKRNEAAAKAAAQAAITKVNE